MNTLYLRIPAKLTNVWPNSILDYALCAKDGAIIGQGRATLTELAKDIFKSKIVLLIAASDVTLLEIFIPAIPEAKLKLALPNLVEDQLITDASECVLMLVAKQANGAGKSAAKAAQTKAQPEQATSPDPINDDSATPNVELGKKRIVAVAERSWLQQLSTHLYGLGAGYVKAVPAQLCMPYRDQGCSALIEEFGQEGSLHYSLRFDDRGIGMLLESAQDAENGLSTVVSLAPAGPILLQLPGELMSKYKAAMAANPAWAERVTLVEFNWPDTISEIKKVGFNLMSALNTAQLSRIQWRMWRWPIALAAAALLVNIIGLNVQYWGLKREASALKLGMMQTYKKSFPKDTVVPFPLDQMKKNLQTAQRNAGQASPDDFTVLLTGFGSAWSSTPQVPKIESIDYKDSALLIHVKGSVPQEDLKRALSFKGLSLKKNSAEVWQVKAE